MATVAEQLRAEREAKKLTVQQIADATKIRTDHVRALEDGNFSAFSAPIYIRGSVKIYASFLKLDVARMLAALDAELKETQKFSEPPPLTEQKKTFVDDIALLIAKVNWKLGLVGLVILIIVIVGLVIATTTHHAKKGDSLNNLPPAVYQPDNSQDTLPLPKK